MYNPKVDLIETLSPIISSAFQCFPIRNISTEKKVAFIKAFIQKMSNDYGFTIKIRIHKGWRTRCEICGNPSTTIVFGHKAIIQDYVYFREYKTMGWLWRSYGGVNAITGKKALWACAIHEFAHVLQQDRVKGTMHTRGWVVAVQELQTLYPFEEIRDVC